MTNIAQRTSDFFTQFPLRTFNKRQLLIRAESTVDHVFFIVEGRVSQYDITPSGNEVTVNVFKPGAFFPMSSAINNTPNHYFFEASIKTIAHAVPTADAVRFLKDNPDILFDLLARVYRGADGILRRMTHLMGGDAKTRLSFELLNAAYRFGEQQRDGSILINLSEGDLARHSGLARETISRLMQSLKNDGLVEIGSGGIVLKDIRKLEDNEA
jgi:CRP-like cAMP-binding protein